MPALSPQGSIRALGVLASIVIIATSSVAAHAAEAESVSRRTAASSPPPVWQAPAIDAVRLAREDLAAADDPRRPYRVGRAQAVGLTPADAGRWRVDDDGTSWALVVSTPDARWTSVVIERLELPAGAALVARDGAGREIARLAGASTRASWRTPPARGERIELELRLPPGVPTDRVSLRVGSMTHGYRGLFERDDEAAGARAAAGGGAGPCNVDLECPLGDPLDDVRRGVVKLKIDAPGVGTFLCSATLINTTENACRALVLTADHCYGQGGGAATTTFIFDYELPACAGGSSDESKFIVGATERARWLESDMRLMELNTAPPSEWRPYFNGWSRALTAPSDAWIVHHPSGDVKKISRDTGPVLNGVVEADHWRVRNWEQGTTEGGSSGAPLLDQDLRVVGQLDFGTASCASPAGWDEFGKLAVGWNDGPTPADRLSDWLDPLGTGAMAIDGVDQSACDAGVWLAVDGQLVDDALGNEDGRLHPGEIARLQLSLANRGITDATSISAVLGSGDPRVTVRESGAVWPDIDQLTVGVASSAPHFELELDPSFPCGSNVPLSLDITESQGVTEASLLVSTGTTTGTLDAFVDDIESGTTGWSETTLLAGRFNPWSPTTTDSHSPSTSWFVPDLSARHDTVLQMPTQDPLPPGAQLRFWHRMDSENGFDGGVLELSTDGASWFDAGPWVTANAYNGGISEGFNSTLAGREAWTGVIPWQAVSVDLSSFEGEALSARWRFALDNFGGGVGWYVDDVQVEVDSRACPSPYVNLMPGARCSGALIPRDPSRPGDCGASKPRLRQRP